MGFHSRRRAHLLRRQSLWIARSRPSALALFAIFLVVDGALLVGMTERWTAALFVQVGLSYLTKLCAGAFGGGHG